jgi:phosphatidylinositol 4-phosphatase
MVGLFSVILMIILARSCYSGINLVNSGPSLFSLKGGKVAFPRRIVVTRKDDSLIVSYSRSRSGGPNALKIDKDEVIVLTSMDRAVGNNSIIASRSSASRNKESSYGSAFQEEYIEAIFGLLELPHGNFLAAIKESEPVESLGPGVRKILQIELIEVPPYYRRTNSKARREGSRAMMLLTKAFSSHNFYFSSSTYDVTRTAQENALDPLDEEEPLWSKGDHRFFWNINLVKPLLDAGLASWISPVVNLWSASNPINVGGMDFDVTLVSRRSRRRQGPRYIKRGIDDNGDVANFVETEQILKSQQSGDVFSFTQIRGSIPLFWSQKQLWKLRPDIAVDNNEPDAHITALQLHLDDLHCNYVYNKNRNAIKSHGNKDRLSGPHVIFVNLIDKKGAQGHLGKLLGRSFERINTNIRDIENDSNDNNGPRNQMTTEDYRIKVSTQIASKKEKQTLKLRHVWFDYHSECRGGNVTALTKLRTSVVTDSTKPGGYFHQRRDGSVVSVQSRVIRTNCIDCLDRTNVVQSTIGRWVLIHQVSLIAEKYSRESSICLRRELQNQGAGNQMSLPNSDAELVFRSLWGDNGDQMSMMYAGTKALKRDVTRLGKRTRQGAFDDGMNSAMRYYINNYLDEDNQRAIDLVIGVGEGDELLKAQTALKRKKDKIIAEEKERKKRLKERERAIKKKRKEMEKIKQEIKLRRETEALAEAKANAKGKTTAVAKDNFQVDVKKQNLNQQKVNQSHDNFNQDAMFTASMGALEGLHAELLSQLQLSTSIIDNLHQQLVEQVSKLVERKLVEEEENDDEEVEDRDEEHEDEDEDEDEDNGHDFYLETVQLYNKRGPIRLLKRLFAYTARLGVTAFFLVMLAALPDALKQIRLKHQMMELGL